MSWWEQLDGPVLGRYRIERLLGEGGMARVFLATDVKAGRAVAFKTPKLESFPPDRVQELLARFNREFRSQASDPIQGVIPIYESGEFTDNAGIERPFLAMQYLSGGSLADKLRGQIGRRDHRQTLGEVLDWLVPIARTLDRLHARKYLHRDVKPDNILFNTDGDPFLADFGIVGTLDDALNGSTLGIVATGLMGSPGSPGYQSPESIQADSSLRNVSSSDQFSLAVSVYEALSGALPARAGTSQEWYGALMHWAPIPLSEPAPEMPQAAVAAVMKAMSLQPRGRFTSCSEFAKALSAATTDAPSAAPNEPKAPAAKAKAAAAMPRPAPATPAQSAPQAPPPAHAGEKKRRWLSAAAALAFVLTGIVGWQLWQSSRERTEPVKGVTLDQLAAAQAAARNADAPASASTQQAPAATSSFVNDLATEIVADANKADEAKAATPPAEMVAVVYVQFDSCMLTVEGTALLDQTIPNLQTNHRRVEVAGHTDSRSGSPAEAAALSQRQAQAVAAYLTSHGIDASRLDVNGYGASRPAAGDANEADWAMNRRVEISYKD